MVMTDPIADMLTRIRNANMVRHEKLEVPASNMKKEIAEILKREGFVRDPNDRPPRRSAALHRPLAEARRRAC